ncbi:MAG TPA: SIMPL domain-containing protein, partial [Longimicrobium sp.]|nr:SIMPL domain-containing protein [Longimicrobium sp.]
MTSRPFPQLFAGMVALALGLVVGSALTAGAVKNIRRGADAIEVTGSARRPIRSDFVVWRLSATTQGGSLADANAELTQHSQRIRAFLRASGVADSTLTITPVQTEPVYRMLESGSITGDLMGHRLTQRFEVRSSDVAGITALSQRAGDLINQGVPLVSGAPEYLYTRLAEVRTAMLAEATEDAKRRADAIARS